MGYLGFSPWTAVRIPAVGSPQHYYRAPLFLLNITVLNTVVMMVCKFRHPIPATDWPMLDEIANPRLMSAWPLTCRSFRLRERDLLCCGRN